MTTTAAESAAPRPARVTLRDFSDRLSPMLVKELRQGLKSPVFTWGLIAMQLALAVMSLIAMDEGNTPDVNAAFWWAVAGTVCLLLPLRVANALRDEMGGNTMDTLILTRLSAWRITLGKWVATCALQILVAVTALPYLILRYFAGGINMPLEVAWLAVFMLLGVVVSAIMLGLSWFRYFLVRAAVMLAVLAAAAGTCGGTIDEISRGDRYMLDRLYAELGIWGLGAVVVMIIWGTFFFLDIGAARIAPISENRSTRRRLAALGTWGLAAAGTFLVSTRDKDMPMALSSMLIMAMFLPCIQAISERPAHYAPVLRPFVKRGLPGRLAGRVLYPGWHSGVVFSLLLLAAAIAITAFHYLRLMEHLNPKYGVMGPDMRTERLLVILTVFGGVLGALVLPLVVWRLFRKMENWGISRWIAVLLAAGAFHLTVTVIAVKSTPVVAFANYLLPSGGMLATEAARQQANEKWQERRAAERLKEAAVLTGDPAERRRLIQQQQNREWQNEWEQRMALREEFMVTHSIAAMTSLAAWLAAAVCLAVREFRKTRRAEEELAAAMAPVP